MRGTGRPGSVEDAWNQALRDGFLAQTGFAKVAAPSGKTDGFAELASKAVRPAPTKEIRSLPSPPTTRFSTAAISTMPGCRKRRIR